MVVVMEEVARIHMAAAEMAALGEDSRCSLEVWMSEYKKFI